MIKLEQFTDEVLRAYARYKCGQSQDSVDLTPTYNSQLPFVIIPSRSNDTSIVTLEEEFRKRTNKNPHDFYVINNHNNSHWDVTAHLDGKALQINTSGEDNACGAYTLFAIIKNSPALQKLPHVINTLAKNQLLVTAQHISPKKVREFIASAIQNNSAIFDREKIPKNKIEESLKKILSSGQMLDSDDLYYACLALTIPTIESNSLKNDVTKINTLYDNIIKNIAGAANENSKIAQENEIREFQTFFYMNYNDKIADDFEQIKNDIIAYYQLQGIDDSLVNDDSNQNNNISSPPIESGDSKKRTHDQISESDTENDNKKDHLNEPLKPGELFELQKLFFIKKNLSQSKNPDFQELNKNFSEFIISEDEDLQKLNSISKLSNNPNKLLNKLLNHSNKLLNHSKHKATTLRKFFQTASTVIPEEFLTIKKKRPAFLIIDFYQVILLWRAKKYKHVQILCKIINKQIEDEQELWKHRPSCNLIPYYYLFDDETIQTHFHPMINTLPLSEVAYYSAMAKNAQGLNGKPDLANCYFYRALQCFIRGMYHEANIYIDKSLATYANQSALFLKPFVELYLNGESNNIIKKYDTKEGLKILEENIPFCLKYYVFLHKKNLHRPKIYNILWSQRKNFSIDQLSKFHQINILRCISSNDLTCDQVIKTFKYYMLFIRQVIPSNIKDKETIIGEFNQTLQKKGYEFVTKLIEQKNDVELEEFLKYWFKALEINHNIYSPNSVKENSHSWRFSNWLDERLYLKSLSNCLHALILVQNNPYFDEILTDLVEAFKIKMKKYINDVSKFCLSKDNGDKRITRTSLNLDIHIAFPDDNDLNLDSLHEIEQDLLNNSEIKNIADSLSYTPINGIVPRDLMDKRPNFEKVIFDNDSSSLIQFYQFDQYVLNTINYVGQACSLSEKNPDIIIRFFQKMPEIIKNLVSLYSKHPRLSRNDLNHYLLIEYLTSCFIIDNLDAVKSEINYSSLDVFKDQFIKYSESYVSLKEKYRETTSNRINPRAENLNEAMLKLDTTIRFLRQNAEATRKPLSFLYGKKESTQFLVDFPIGKIEDRIRQNPTHAFKDTANLSVHYITVVYKIDHHGEVLHIPVPYSQDSLSHPVVTLEDSNDQSYQTKIINLVQQGDKITNLSARDKNLVLDRFDNQLHKHSEQAFFVWLLQYGKEFIIKNLSNESSLENKQKDQIRLLVISFDYGSRLSSCKYCSLAAIAIQSKNSDFAKNLTAELTQLGYQLPKSGLHITSRVLYTKERTSDSYYKTLIPKLKNAKFFSGKEVLSEEQPAIYGSGGKANKL